MRRQRETPAGRGRLIPASVLEEKRVERQAAAEREKAEPELTGEQFLRAEKTLLENVGTNRGFGRRRDLVRMLGASRDIRARELLEELVLGDIVGIRGLAAVALAKIGDKHSIPILSNAKLNEVDSKTRRQIQFAINIISGRK